MFIQIKITVCKLYVYNTHTLVEIELLKLREIESLEIEIESLPSFNEWGKGFNICHFVWNYSIAVEIIAYSLVIFIVETKTMKAWAEWVTNKTDGREHWVKNMILVAKKAVNRRVSNVHVIRQYQTHPLPAGAEILFVSFAVEAAFWFGPVLQILHSPTKLVKRTWGVQLVAML